MLILHVCVDKCVLSLKFKWHQIENGNIHESEERENRYVAFESMLFVFVSVVCCCCFFRRRRLISSIDIDSINHLLSATCRFFAYVDGRKCQCSICQGNSIRRTRKCFEKKRTEHLPLSSSTDRFVMLFVVFHSIVYK
jgi:hypothetical protein